MLFLNFALAMLPIAWLILSLGKLKMPSHKACGIALLITIALAFSYWRMNVLNASTAVLEGTLNALWPICLVIVAALFTYNLTLKTGAMDLIKKMLAGISGDKRIILLIIGWGFGNFMEGMAGFGTAVAIPASMLAGIGLDPINSVVACLIANSTPTAFGSVGVPGVTLAAITGLDTILLSGKTALIQLFITALSPFLMVAVIGGSIKALKGIVHIVVIASLSFIVPWFFAASFLGPELPNIIGSITSMICIIAAVKIFKIKTPEEYSVRLSNGSAPEKLNISIAEGLRAWAPFILIFVLLMLTSPLCPPVYNALKGIKSSVVVYSGEGAKPLSFSWVNTPGVIIFTAAFIGAFIQRAKIGEIFKVLFETAAKYWKTVFTICAVMSAAKVMIHSGMISDIAKLLAGTGAFYPFVSPLIGVLGAFITGSGTSTSVLFGNLQQETALSLSLSQYWIAAANLMGAGIGKMVCPQCIAIGTGAVNAGGSESKILSKVFKYFLLYALLSGTICFVGAKLGI